MGMGALTPGIKQPGDETDLSLYPVQRLRMHGTIPSPPPHIIMACSLIKYRDNFTLPLQIL
jgi:hypothetical protein